MTIFAWPILPKSLLHRILPPMYRSLGQLMTLPRRRYYTPATDYTNVPFSPDPNGGLRAIPSVLDLPGMVELEVDNVMSTSRRVCLESVAAARAIKLRAGKTGANGKGEAVRFVDMPGQASLEELGGEGGTAVKHYDADGRIGLAVFLG